MKLTKIISLTFFIAVVLSSLNCGEDAQGTNGVADELAEKVTDVKVKVIEPGSFVDYIEVAGTVIADVLSTVSAEEAGVIEKFLEEKGAWVKKGAVVVKLHSKVLQANYEEAKANYLLSKAIFERQANLFEDNVISEQKYLEYKYSYERDKARYENLQARLEKTEIRSPIHGTIEEKVAEIGEYVQPGTPLFKVVKVDPVKIRADVPERYLQNVRVGSTANISFDILPEHEFTAQVTFVGPSINKSSRTFPIEIELQNKDGLLKPQMYANVNIKKAEVDSVIVISRDAVIETESGKYAFVAQGNIAAKHEIKLGGSVNNQVWVKEGLQPGDRLIVVGHRDLVDGERIRIHE